MSGPRPLLFAIKSLAVGGGAERVFVDVVNGLAARGHSIAVLSFDTASARAFYPLACGVPWLRIGATDATKAARPLETLRRMTGGRRAIAAMQPAICVAFMHSCYLPIGVALLGSGVPMIASEHIVPAHYRRLPAQRAMLQLTPLLAARVTVVSDAVRALYPGPLRRKMCVVPNPVTLSVDGRADAVGPAGGRKRLLSIGRLSSQKDFVTLIEAFSRLAERHPDWDLRIVGEGGERPKLDALTAHLGLRHRVALPGTSPDVGTEYRAAQLFVLPSLYESQGLAAVEAIAHGLPAVAFADCPGLAEVVDDGVNGRLARGRDRVDALVDALSPLMADPAQRVALASPEGVDLESVSLSRVLDRWEALLREHVR